MLRVTILKQRIQQHRADCWRQADGEPRVHAIAPPAFEDLDERQVSLRDGLEQPIFLQEFLVLRMAHKGQVRVEDKREIALHVDLARPRQNPANHNPQLTMTLQRVSTDY